MLNKLKKELDIAEAKVRFIQDFIKKEIDIINKEDEEVIKQLEERNYPRLNKTDDSENYTYDYLLNMQIKFDKKKN